MMTSTQVKRELFMKLLDDVENVLLQNPQGDADALLDGVLDNINLAVKD